MNNNVSTALVILTVLWLVRDVYAPEPRRKTARPDFFFDDALENSTPLTNPANASPLQKIIRSTLPPKGKGKGNSNKSGDDRTPQISPFTLGNMGSLTDMWKLLQQMVTILNPLASPLVNNERDPRDVSRTDAKRNLSPKLNLTGTTSSYGDMDLDDPFETTIEYASGNDSFDDEDYELSMNFSSPNPQMISTSLPTVDDNLFLTPKSENQSTTQPYNTDNPVTSDPNAKKRSLDQEASKSPPDVARGKDDILKNEFIDDFINKPLGKIPDKNSNVTSPPLKGNETLNQSQVNGSISDRNNKTSTSAVTPTTPEGKNGTTAPTLEIKNKIDFPSLDSNCSETETPNEKNTVEETTTMKTTELNPPQTAFTSTQASDLTGLTESKYDYISTTEAVFDQKSTVAPVKPPKRRDIKTTASTREDQVTKAPDPKQKVKNNIVPGNISTTVSPLEQNNNLKNENRSLPKETQLPKPKNITNQIIYDKPSLVVNPFNITLTPAVTMQPISITTIPTTENKLNKTTEEPEIAKPLTPQNELNKKEPPKIQTNYTKPLIPQNQLGRKREPSQIQAPKQLAPSIPLNKTVMEKQSNDVKSLTPQIQLNKTIEAPVKQPNDTKPMTSQIQPNKTSEPTGNQTNIVKPRAQPNLTNAEKVSSSNTTQNMPSLTPEDTKGFATFLNKFPRIKALLPKLANLPLLQMVLNNTETTTDDLNCTDAELLTQAFITTTELPQEDFNSTILSTQIDFNSTILSTNIDFNNTIISTQVDFNGTTLLMTTATPDEPEYSTTLPSVQKLLPTTPNPPVVLTPLPDSEHSQPDYSDTDSSPERSSGEYKGESDGKPDDADDKPDEKSDKSDEKNEKSDEKEDTSEGTDDKQDDKDNESEDTGPDAEDNEDSTEDDTDDDTDDETGDDADDDTDDDTDDNDTSEDADDDTDHENEYEEIDDLSIYDDDQYVTPSTVSKATTKPVSKTTTKPRSKLTTKPKSKEKNEARFKSNK